MFGPSQGCTGPELDVDGDDEEGKENEVDRSEERGAALCQWVKD